MVGARVRSPVDRCPPARRLDQLIPSEKCTPSETSLVGGPAAAFFHSIFSLHSIAASLFDLGLTVATFDHP